MSEGLDLGKQVGPLPLGAWIAVVGAGLGLAYYTRSQSSGSTDPSALDSTGGGGLSTLGGGEDGVGVGPGWVAVPPPTDSPVAETPQDNDAWGRLAINYLIANGYDAAKSQAAIGHALQGTNMSVSEYALWGIALAHFGAPPYPVDVVPPTNVPGPVTPPLPPPRPATGVLPRWYIIKGNMTLHKVSRKFYHNNPHRADDIYNANVKGKKRPSGIMPFIAPSPGWLTKRNYDAKLPAGYVLFIPK